MNAQQNENERTIEINLAKLGAAFLRRWWVFLIVVGYLAVVAYGGTKFLVEPTYQATTKIYVNNFRLDSETTKVTSSDMSAAAGLVKLYSVFLNTNDTLTQIIQEARLPYSQGELKKMLATAAVDNTQVFSVTVTSHSPEEAMRIAETVGQILPVRISETVEGADAKVVEHATRPSAPSGPNSTRNAILGALIGFMIVAAVITIRVISDTTIHGEKDVEEMTKLPILVTIPDLTGNDKKKKSYGKYGYNSSSKYYYAPKEGQ